jgi:hypothetical protein
MLTILMPARADPAAQDRGDDQRGRRHLASEAEDREVSTRRPPDAQALAEVGSAVLRYQ